MVLITINVPHEIRVCLQQEPNQSGLVTALLKNHYKVKEFGEYEFEEKEKNLQNLLSQTQLELQEISIEKNKRERDKRKQKADATKKERKIEEERALTIEARQTYEKLFKDISSRDTPDFNEWRKEVKHGKPKN